MLKFVIIPFLIHIATYWSMSALFYLLDRKYLDKNHVNWINYGTAARNSFLNQLFVGLPTLYFTENYIIAAVNKSLEDSYIYILFKLILIGTIANILFYLSHRLLHTRFIFTTIHYIHHQFIEPVAVASLHAHPIEHLTANTLAFFIPFFIIGLPYYMMLFMICIGTNMIVLSHVNYNIPFYGNEHKIHHIRFKYNFGIGMYLDKFFNTYTD